MLKLYLVLSCFALCTASTVFAPKCPPGTVPPKNGNETTCYLFVNQSMPFADAEEYCRQQNGHLVTVTDVFSDLFFADQAHDHFPTAASFWIGARVVNYTCNVWLWTNNNELLVYSNWKYPPDSGTAPAVGSCAAETIADITWTSTPCSQSLPFVCEVPGVAMGACDAGYQLYPLTNMCYKLFNVSTTGNLHSFNESESICRGEGGHLVSIHSSEENTFVSLMAPGWATNNSMHLWIGLSTDGNNVTTWTDGSVYDYSNWDEWHAYPNMCNILFSDGISDGEYKMQWFSYYCNDQLGRFICKKPLSPLLIK